MFKKFCLLCMIIILTEFLGSSVSAAEQPAVPELQLEYVDIYGVGSEKLYVKIPMTEAELAAMDRMLVYYSLDGDNYAPVIHPRMEDPWDLCRYGSAEFDQNVYVNECMNPATTPFKQFLAGEIDSFWVKIHLIADTYDCCTKSAKLERSRDVIPLPEDCTVEASYPRSITEAYRDENGQVQMYAAQSVEIPQGKTREQILEVLPESYDMEVIIIQDSYNLLGELPVSYQINWNIPDHPETLTTGQYIIDAGNEVIPPAGSQIFKKGLQQYVFTAPPTEMSLRLILNIAEADENDQSSMIPPSSNHEESNGADENFGSGGNRGDVGSNDLNHEGLQPESQPESQSELHPELQPESYQEKDPAKTDYNEIIPPSALQTVPDEIFLPGREEIPSETEETVSAERSDLETDSNVGNVQEEIIPNRNKNMSPTYILFVGTSSVAISAGIALFVYWRKWNLKI